MFLSILTVSLLALAQNPTDIQQGKQLFEGLCADCHGFEGAGGRAPTLNRPTLTRAQDDESLRAFAMEFPTAVCLACAARPTMNSGNSSLTYVR